MEPFKIHFSYYNNVDSKGFCTDVFKKKPEARIWSGVSFFTCRNGQKANFIQGPQVKFAAFDAVYINGANRIGWNLVVGLAIRPTNTDGFLILKVPGMGLLLSPKLPRTVLQVNHEEEHFSSEGLKLSMIEPMKAWRLEYNGVLRFIHNSNKKVRVKLDGMWKSDLDVFNYDTDISARNVAQAMSSEPWTRDYFKCLRDNHQTHYEQFGELRGSVIIDGIDFNMNLSAMRDHSFGIRREWKAFHRYVLHIFTLADGRRGNVGIVCLPSMFTRLEIGYVYCKDGSLSAVSDIDFELYQHGENGIPPKDYGFTFKAGKEFYEVKVHVEDTAELFLGLEGEGRIVESLCRFTVNNIEGWGAVEWMYSHLTTNS